MDLKTKKVTIIVVAILAVAFIFYVVSNALPSWYVTIVPTIFDLVHSVTTFTFCQNSGLINKNNRFFL